MGTSLTAIIAFVVLAFVIKFATRLIIKVLGFLLVVGVAVGFMYYYSIGPFEGKEVSIAALRFEYCGNEMTQDEDVCDCVVELADSDMKNRFSAEELTDIKQSKYKSTHVLIRSLDATKTEALQCLASRDAEHKYKEMIQNFIPVENKHLESLQEGAQDFGDYMKEKYDSLLEDTESIEERY